MIFLQINNPTVLKDLIEISEKNNKLSTILTTFIILNLVIAIINIITQFRLKSREKKNQVYLLREERRINVIEDLYRKLENLTNMETKSQLHKTSMLKRISEIEKYILQNKLYIKNEIQNVTECFCDYYRKVLTDNRKKDYKFEMQQLEKFSKLFNK